MREGAHGVSGGSRRVSEPDRRRAGPRTGRCSTGIIGRAWPCSIPTPPAPIGRSRPTPLRARSRRGGPRRRREARSDRRPGAGRGDPRLPAGVGTRRGRHGHRLPRARPQGGICALKVLSRRLLGDDPTFATRFKREAQYAEALDHPHVVELYEAGETPDGTLYLRDAVRGRPRSRGADPPRRRVQPASGPVDPRARSVMRSTARTRTASCIATSSRATSSWRMIPGGPHAYLDRFRPEQEPDGRTRSR